MVFSTNQVRQLYVAKTLKSTKDALIEEGDIMVDTTRDNDFYFRYVGAGGNLMRSDLIKKENILRVKITAAQELRTPIKSVTITLDDEINAGRPIAGQDYILNIYIRQFVGMSDTDVYIKQGVVRGTSADGATNFYSKLAVSLIRNFAREQYPLLRFVLGGTEVVKVGKKDGKDVPMDKDGNVVEATAEGLTITEYPQEWRLGVKEQTPVYFDVMPTTVEYEGEEVIWGKVEDTTVTTVADLDETNSYGNGRKIADLEYFCMGERGDQYRQIGWPHNLHTDYLVDATEEYNTLDIHYAFVGGAENPQLSEKDITIVSTDFNLLDIIKSDLVDAQGRIATIAEEPDSEETKSPLSD